MNSILDTIKKLLGLPLDYYPFDDELIVYINTAINALSQMGVGPEEGYSIKDSSDTWADFLGESRNLEMVKTYIHLKVKQIFDNTGSTSLNAAIENQLKELEFRISVQVDPGKKEV